MDIKKFLTDATKDDIFDIISRHLVWSGLNYRTAGSPRLPGPGELIAFGVRCNDERDVNNGKWNDYLVLIKIGADGASYIKNVIRVTVDPGREKDGVAHLQQGVWNSYKIRAHNFASRTFPRVGYIPRWAICNDLDVVGITRTDGKGGFKLSERVQAKTNIHDRIGIDPSLGCTVVMDDDDYVDLFLPMLRDINEGEYACTNWQDITYCLVNLDRFEVYVNEQLEKVDRADSARGDMEVWSPGAMGATKTVEFPVELDTNEEGLQFIKDAEGLELNAYKDSGGVWTVGYGDTMIDGKPVYSSMKITKEEAETNLRNDVDVFENTIKKNVKVELNQNQFSALVSLCYNIGQGAFAQSTLLKKLNANDYNGAADQFLVWKKDNGKVVQGLLNRREKERTLFLKAA